MADLNAGLLGLLRHLSDAFGIADGTQGGGAAHGDDVALAAVGGQNLTALAHLGVDVLVAVGVHEFHLGTEDVVQHQVAFVVRDAPFFQDQGALHAQASGAGGGEHGMVGLGAAGGEHGVAALLLGVRQQVFQLADLVAAQGHAAQVIPLDPDVLIVDAADVFQPVKGRGVHAQFDVGKGVPVAHVRSFSSK